MEKFLEELQTAIANHQEEIDHLQNEREALRQEENNMSFNEYNREYQNIINHLEKERQALEEAENTLQAYRDNYDLANSSIKDLRNLRDLLKTTTDEQERSEIIEEIIAKEGELRRALNIIPDEMAEYLRNTFLEENTNEYHEEQAPNLQEEKTSLKDNQDFVASNKETPDLSPLALTEYQEIANQLAELKAALQDNDELIANSIKNFQAISKEEKDHQELEGPFDTETLNSFQEHYMNLKLAENEIYIEAKNTQKMLQRKIKNLERKQRQIIEMDTMAQALDISYEEYKKLSKTLENKKIINDILDKKGLKEIVHKKGGRSNKEKAELQRAKKEIYQEIIDYLNKHTDKNIKDAINVLYGMDFQVTQEEEPKKTKITSSEKENIAKNVQKVPANIRKDKENHQTKALQAPEDMPRLKAAAGQDVDSEKIEPPKKNQEEQEEKETKEEVKIAKEPLKRGLREIFGDLRQGLNIGKKDGSRYRRSNLQVSSNFRQELQSGNVAYNVVHVVPAVVKATTQLLSKISGKILLGQEAKEMMETLKERIDKLPAEDLETIFREYRGNRINQERYPEAFNMVIEEKMSEYTLGKVMALNSNIEQCYKQVFYAKNLLTSIDENLRKGKMTGHDRIHKLEQRKALLKQAANSIKYIRKAKIEADNLLSSGLHGLSEDMKAASTKLNCVGMRFAKSYDMDQELEDQLMECEKRENAAIYNENDEELLEAFIASEVLLNNNTEISSSLLGKRSTGKKYYSPLAEQLDYRNDPFVRDLFTTIAVTSAAVSAYNAYKPISSTQDNFANQVHQAGLEITSRRGAMYEGMQAQAEQDVLNSAGAIERGTLDSTGWSLGTDAYHVADKAGHAFYNNFYNQVQNRFADITNAYSRGNISQMEAIEELTNISNQAQSTLSSVVTKCLEVLKPYAKNNPQFDLGAVEDTMQFIVDHPDAIANMNRSMLEIQNIGDTLIALSSEQLSTISHLPGNLTPTLLAAASSAAVASKVATNMANANKKDYGNDVTDMVEEYAEGLKTPEEESENVK